jgi:CSLREA domain-containing protein
MVANKIGSLVLLVLAMGVAPVAGAATFTVTTTLDEVDANPGDGACLTATGQCSLRAAIQQANASGGADIIILPVGIYRLEIGSQGEDAAAEGDLDITSEIVINGAAADTTIVDGMKRDRLFHIHRTGVATINKLTIRNGSANNDGMGGGLSNRGGVVTLNDCNVYRNFGSAFGGGLDNNSFGGSGNANNSMARMTINRCTISNNIVMGNGGGISNNGGILIVNDSTIRDNKGGQFADSVQGGGIYNNASDLNLPGVESARLEVNRSLITGHSVMTDGGGIYHLFGNMTISNSTLSDNEAKRNGGGIYIANTFTRFSTNRIVHTTITKNRAYANDSSIPSFGFGGGGIMNGNPANPSGVVTTLLENSVIAANGNGGNCYNSGLLVKQGNLLGDDSCNNSGEVAGPSYTAAQIGLGELKYNGGATLTHALLPGSLAINAGVTALCTAVDQRGYTRPATGCDAGAFEVEGVVPATPLQPTPPPPGGVSTDGQNRVPLVFTMPTTAIAGMPMHGVLNGVDYDGDPLTYKIVAKTTHGAIGLDDTIGTAQNAIPGSYTYVADAGFSGVDSFTYQACDFVSCSEPVAIFISVSSGVAVEEIGIQLESPGTGTPSPITVVTGQDLDVVAPDTDPSFSYPLGAFFFEVKDVPSNPVTQADGVVVTLQLPAGATIAANAVIRKLDNTGVWRTLGTGPNPTETTGTINAAARTITLVLRDNDRFDTNLALGAITDPVAIAVPSNAVATDDSTASSSGGGGAVNMLALAGLLLAYRRRLH